LYLTLGMKRANKKEKVVVAMSGGVDSSVTALLMKKAGYEVIGLHMKLGFENDNSETAARKVCQQIGVKFYPVNISRKFKEEVVKYFLDSYEKGITPNPCIRCNKLIKFGELLKIVEQLGCDYLATGHYVTKKIGHDNSFKLCKGKDAGKDQSYFLYTLSQSQLSKILFPLGAYKKEEIKQIALKNELPNLKKESQDVCFLNIDDKNQDHNSFLIKHIKMKTGDIELNGRIVGKHNGLPLYTIGQRKGVELGGQGPFYVLDTDYKTNTLHITDDNNDQKLYRKQISITETNWINPDIKFPLKCEAVLRYHHQPIAAVVKEQGKGLVVEFEKPQRAIAGGQSIVFYCKDEVLGGGIQNK